MSWKYAGTCSAVVAVAGYRLRVLEPPVTELLPLAALYRYNHPLEYQGRRRLPFVYIRISFSLPLPRAAFKEQTEGFYNV